MGMNYTQQRREPWGAPPEVVRDFYEKMPYPAPLTSLDEYQELYRNPERRRANFHLMWPTRQFSGKQEILVAGCGTSQAARYALREPEARVTAIDISETSLRHTRDLQREYNLENLDLHRLPIERVQELGRSFDQIVCTGVLHHLQDPGFGLRALRDLLRPEGAMRLMVYARYGRAGIYMMQEYCRLLGVGDSDKDLRRLAAVLKLLPGDHAIAAALRRAKDFQQPEAMADALLHPRDRAYTVPELFDWLEQSGMSFGRWVEQAPYLPQCGMVAKSAHAALISSLSPCVQYAAVELFRGTMVSHSFIAYRDDRAEESQPITFTDERWRDYVPIALPWTVCVRGRNIPGSVAVMINRAHTCTDLICTVDGFEEGLLDAIGANRTLAEILRSVDGDRSRDQRARNFFERLWQYDQVVFDASPGAGRR
jgi:SAM-dependent methyltransferase